MHCRPCCAVFFKDTATTEIYTLPLHDALPISRPPRGHGPPARPARPRRGPGGRGVGHRARGLRAAPRQGGGLADRAALRSEEHTSELQSRQYLVCRLLLEKTKQMSDMGCRLNT